MRASLLISFLISGVFLVGCATTASLDPKPLADAPPSDAPNSAAGMSNRLSPQVLAPGECGLFAWDNAADPRFIFFAKPGSALYAPREGPVRPLSAEGDFPAMDYGPVQLTLGPAEAMIDGVRYPSARLKETLKDGFTRIQPIVVLQTCQRTESRSAKG